LDNFLELENSNLDPLNLNLNPYNWIWIEFRLDHFLDFKNLKSWCG